MMSEPSMPEPAAEAFIPPAPERGRAPRMPRIEEFPLPAQNQMRAHRADQEDEAEDKPRLGLLQRLAAGLSRKEEEAPEERPPVTRQKAPPMPRQAPRPPESRGPEPVSDYAKRPPHLGLDSHGRAAPVHNPVEEDQLDIPAFLRRQAN